MEIDIFERTGNTTYTNSEGKRCTINRPQQGLYRPVRESSEVDINMRDASINEEVDIRTPHNRLNESRYPNGLQLV